MYLLALLISDEFELKFPKLSQAKLKSFQAESSQAVKSTTGSKK